MQYGKVHHLASHFPVLLYAVQSTSGDVLELGTGLYSTPLLHYLCVPSGRCLVSVENDINWLMSLRMFECDLHRLIFTDDWNVPELEKQWDVVFVDQFPAEQRRKAVERFASLAKYIVVHDTNGRQDRHYHLSEVWPSFKYVYHYGRFFPQTTIASNFQPIGAIC